MLTDFRRIYLCNRLDHFANQKSPLIWTLLFLLLVSLLPNPMLFVVHGGEYALRYSAVHFAEISQHVNLLAHFMDVRKGFIN